MIIKGIDIRSTFNKTKKFALIIVQTFLSYMCFRIEDESKMFFALNPMPSHKKRTS